MANRNPSSPTNPSKSKKARKKSGSKKSRARKSRAKGTSTSEHASSSGPLTGASSPPAVRPSRTTGERRPSSGGAKGKTQARSLLGVDSAPKQHSTAAPRSSSAPRTAATPPQRSHPTPSARSADMTLAQIYETLAALLVPYARKMESEMHPKIGFCLKAKSARTGRETHFGAVQALPDGVAYHLFPLYGHPDLLENISPELFNRMRGKTCFQFDSLHAGLVAELAELTHAGFERFLADGVLQ